MVIERSTDDVQPWPMTQVYVILMSNVSLIKTFIAIDIMAGKPFRVSTENGVGVV